jgi:type IV secretory pathway VirJ component
VNRLIRAQAHYVQHALRWHEQHAQTPRRSHARREVYDVLWLVSQSLLRMGKEPRRTQAWAPDLEAVMIHSHRFIGQLAAVKGLLTAQHGAWHGEQVTAALAESEQRVLATLAGDLDAVPAMAIPSSTSMETGAETIPVDGAIMAGTHEQALMAWLVNRLTETEQAAQSLAHAARAFRQHAAP